MPIGTSDGKYYENAFELHNDGGVDGAGVPLESPRKPAGALKPSEGSQTPEKVLETNYLEKLTGFKDPWGEFKRQVQERTEANAKDTRSTQEKLLDPAEIDKAIHIGMATGPGAIEKFDRYIGMFMKPAKLPEGKTDANIADEVSKILAEWKSKEAKTYEGDVFVKPMSPEDVQKMKDSWKQQPFNPDTWDAEVKAFAAMQEATHPKMSVKEAFQQAAEDVHAKLMTSFANLRNKYIQSIKGPEAIPAISPTEKALQQGYTQPAFKGMMTVEGQAPNPVQKFGGHQGGSYSELYSTESPLLAEMYAGWLGKKTSAPRPHGPIEEGEFAQGAQVVPLLINPKDYHVYDAAGKSWQFVNQKAIDEARKLGKPGVIMKNVWDEPGSTTYLGAPKTVYITLPKGASTVKSRFAKNFDPSSPDMLNSVAALGIGGAAGYFAFKNIPKEYDHEKHTVWREDGT